MKWSRQKRVHINKINSISNAKLSHENSSESNVSKLVANADHSGFERLMDRHDSPNDPPPKLSLDQMVASPERISSQLKRLERNYQSDYLGFKREMLELKILVAEDRDRS